jgi:putative acetyltransferase
MGSQRVDIITYNDKYREQVLEVWEQSVLATHQFLKQADFQTIKQIVRSIDFNAFEMYCLVADERLFGFLGVADQKIEMLFLSPSYLGKGLGKRFMEFALRELKVNKVDVNEQNTNAVEFYKRFGFKTYERSEKDDQGNDYPILRMRL